MTAANFGCSWYGSITGGGANPFLDGYMWDINWISGTINDNVIHTAISPNGFNDSNPIGVDNDGTVFG